MGATSIMCLCALNNIEIEWRCGRLRIEYTSLRTIRPVIRGDGMDGIINDAPVILDANGNGMDPRDL